MQKIELEKQELSYQFSEEMKMLRSNIQFCGTEKKLILVTSTIPNEGKSSIVYYLCSSMAELGKKVLLLDADVRKSVFKRRLKEKTELVGLSHYLSGQNTMEEILYETTQDGLSIIYAGPSVPNPAELLAGERMKTLLREVREQYDYVFIDSAPLNSVVDGVVIAPNCDGAVIVVHAGETPRRMVRDTADKLKNTGIPTLGVILNQVERQGGGRYGRYYSYGYDRYYKKYYGEYR